ncbi:hypothetical protein Tco_0027427 [Tanacetum coccineum]
MERDLEDARGCSVLRAKGRKANVSSGRVRLVSGVNTPGSDENRLKLYDLILGDDASKQGRIDIGDINTDAEITLIDETQGRINDIIADEDITLIS